MAEEVADAGKTDESQENQSTQEERDYLSRDEVDELIAKATQSAADRVRTEYSQKLKDEQKKSMSEAEKLAADMKEIKEQLVAEKQARGRKEVEAYALKRLAEVGIDAEWVDDVVGESQEATTERIDRLKARLEKRESKAKKDGYKEFVKDADRSPGTGEDKTVMTPDQYAREIEVAARAKDHERMQKLRAEQSAVLAAALKQ